MAFTNIHKEVIKEMTPLALPENVITELTKDSFQTILQNNPGAFIVKFGAEWCGPCKKADPLIYDWMSKMPPSIQCAIVDIDENFEVYAFLKSKKMVNGIPVLLCYQTGNISWIPDQSVTGADDNQINMFFQKCLGYAAK